MERTPPPDGIEMCQGGGKNSLGQLPELRTKVLLLGPLNLDGLAQHLDLGLVGEDVVRRVLPEEGVEPLGEPGAFILRDGVGVLPVAAGP